MLRHLSPVVVAILLAFLSPAVLRADTIYYRQNGVAAIKTVSGTIVKDAGGVVEITTADGRTLSIPKDSVFQITRGNPVEGRAASGDPEAPQKIDVPGFAATSSLANRSAFDDPPQRPVACHYGLKGGLGISNVRADPQELEESGSLRGYALGLWWGVPLSQRFAIQAEALFSMKGDSETASGYTASTHLSYFDLPILAKFKLLPDAPVQPLLFVGPSLGFNLTANSSLEGDDGEVEVDVKDQVGTLDFGLVLGGGLDFRGGNRTFGVDVRYCRGLRDIGDGVDASVHNEAIVIMGSVALR